MLTDKEFRHYQELYNNDPVVQRLCKMDFNDDVDHETEKRIADLEDTISDLEYEKDCLEDDLYELEKENQSLKEKIQVWETLESKNDDTL